MTNRQPTPSSPVKPRPMAGAFKPSAANQARLQRLTKTLGTGYIRLGKTHLQRMLVLSAVVHAIVLAVRFVPDDLLKRFDKEALNVVLVNASSDEVPSEAQALANANLLGGGESDAGMVKSPVLNMNAIQDSDDIAFLQNQIKVLEQEQAKLLASLKGQSLFQANSGVAQNFNPRAGAASENNTAPLMREIAALDKQVQDYNKRPKRRFISPATKIAAFASYYASWSDRTERLGTEFYPEAARGKSATVTVTVSVRSDGSLHELVLEQSSGDKAIDHGALRLLKRLAPFPAFDATLKQTVDILDITTKLVFTPAGTFTAELSAGAAPTTPNPTLASPAKP